MADERFITETDEAPREPGASRKRAGRVVVKRLARPSASTGQYPKLPVVASAKRYGGPSEKTDSIVSTDDSASIHGRYVVIEKVALKRAIVRVARTRAVARASAERSAITDFEAEAGRLGVPLGAASTDDEALTRLGVVAADAIDLFATPAAAMAYLTTKPLDGKGRNGVQILRDKGLPGIISGLDHLRFGPRG